MKIGLNATCFNDRPSGAKQRFVGIYSELFRHLSNDEFVVYEPADCQLSSWFDDPANVVYKKTPLSSRTRLIKYLRGLIYWPKSLKGEKFDVFEGFHLPLVSAPAGRTVLTIHDVRGISLGKSKIGSFIYKMLLMRSLKAADHVITVSEFIRNEILGLCPNVPVSVIYNGIDIEEFENIPEAELQKVRRKFNLPGEYLLAVGHFEERKNYLALVDAVDRLHKSGRLISLILIGNDSGEMAAVKERVRSLSLEAHVNILSGITDIEVRCIYKMCKLFVFPSTYEGFGIPILEAMAAKRPMVLSDIPVFREITQGKGVYFPHNDPASIAGVIDEVLSSVSECDRLVEYGNERVDDFSFKKISMDLARVYRSLS